MDLPLWKVLVLAIVQGIAEFLPISSSGHVVVTAELLSPGNRNKLDILDLNIALHLGTLGSILVVYFHRILGLLTENRKLIGLLIVGSIPAAVVGLTMRMYFKEVLENVMLAGVCFIVTGCILLAASRRNRTPHSKLELSYAHSLYIGLAQSLAILPGISRSGTTISTGLMLGHSPKTAATFSFLLAIPIIGGAGILECASLLKASSDANTLGPTTPFDILAIGALVAFVVGYAALQFLLRTLERGRFHWFASWCIPVGIAVVIWQVVT